MNKRSRDDGEEYSHKKRRTSEDEREEPTILLKETASSEFADGTEDRFFSFKIIKFVTLSLHSDSPRLLHKIEHRGDDYDVRFYYISNCGIEESFLENIKRLDSNRIREVTLIWSKKEEGSFFEILVSVSKAGSHDPLEESKERKKAAEKEVSEFRKKIRNNRLSYVPVSWKSDSVRLEEIIRKIYTRMEPAEEDMPLLDISLEIDHDKKRYVLSTGNMERVSLCFLRMLNYKKRFDLLGGNTMSVYVSFS